VKRGFLNRNRQIGLVAAKSMMGKSAERGKCPVPIKSYRKKSRMAAGNGYTHNK
jgi:hypothetical protein